MVKHIESYEQFQEIINGDKPVVIDFWADWCPPCIAIAPFFEELAQNNEGGPVDFYKVDIDAQEQIAMEAGITAIPTFQAYHKGQRLEMVRGGQREQIQALIDKAKAKVAEEPQAELAQE